MRIVVVGGGIVGTMHAVLARRRGHEVVHLDRHAEPYGASVRNFGMIWVSGRAPGAELRLGLRARQLWGEIAADCPGLGFRPNGSLTCAQSPEETKVLEEVASAAEAAERGVRLLDPDEARRVNPALRGRFESALHCANDALVEPRLALSALRRMLAGDGYRFEQRTAVDVGALQREGDAVVLCTGDAFDLLGAAPPRLKRRRLQMLETEPLGEDLTTSLADGDSLRYYPAYSTPAAAALPPMKPVVEQYGMQLLAAQRLDGGLTVGDTHDDDEPDQFRLDEAPYEHLLERLGELLGRPAPPVRQRWSGVYSYLADPASGIYHRDRPAPDVHVVTGLAGRGMTLSPAAAEETMLLIDGRGPVL